MRQVYREKARRSMRLLALTLACVVGLGSMVAVQTAPASASVASGFQPGNIISDGNFYNGAQMTASEVQAFLNARVPNCWIGNGDPKYRPGAAWGNTTIAKNCLRDYRMSTQSKPADAYCGAYPGGNNETAAQIIAKVGAACNIGQRVLLVLLEKEQGLVTDPWPTEIQYRSATGYGCPDTAPCATQYYGFFNQLYKAASTYNYYRKHQSSFNYRAGVTNRIYWHPNQACGTSNVFIENDATAGLYIYTPYRPNQAALNAGWGTGDSCSSYGNRNFYMLYKSWFGNPTQEAVLAKANGNAAVYLLADGKKHHIQAEAYSQYLSAFGPRATVPKSTLDALPKGPAASFYVKNSANGEVAFLDGGKTHRFTSCGLVADWGGACGASLVSLPNSLFTRFGAGQEMTSYAKVQGAQTIYRVSRTSLLPFFDVGVAQRENGGRTPFAATLPAAAHASKSIDRVAFDPDTFVRVSGKPEVLLAMRNGQTAHLANWDAAADLGLPSTVKRVLAEGDLREYTAGPKLTQWVSCGSTSYIGSNGQLVRIPGETASAFAPAVLDSSTCKTLRVSGVTVTGRLFVKSDGDPKVFMVESGQRRHVTSRALLEELAGTSKPIIVAQRAGSIARIPLGQPVLKEGSFIRAEGQKEVFLVAGTSRVHLPSWEIARAYGLEMATTVLPADIVESLSLSTAPLGLFAECSGDSFFANNGGLIKLSDQSLRADNDAVALSSAVCSQLKIGPQVRATPLFVSDGSRTAAAALGGFMSYDTPQQIELAAAGKAPSPLTVSAELFDRLPAPKRYPQEATLARSSSSSEVFLIANGARLRLPNWGIANDLGISTPYEVFAPAALGRVLPAAGAQLSTLVSCGDVVAIAGSGTLTPISTQAVGSLPVTNLDELTCARLTFANSAPAASVMLRAAGASEVYMLRDGRITAFQGQATSELDSPVITMDARSLSALLAVSG